jgi:uncharacterized membrane protein YccC
MIASLLWIETGWNEGATAASFVALFCALFATLDDPAPAILVFSLASVVSMALAATYVFGVLQAIDGFPMLAAVLFPPLFLTGIMIAEPKTASLGVAFGITFSASLALQPSLRADFAAFLNGNLAIYVGSFIAVFLTRAFRSMTAAASAERLLRLTWGSIARIARRGLPLEPRDVTALLIDRLALLTPRLAAQQEASQEIAEEALRDVRVAMNLLALKGAEPSLGARERAGIDSLMDGVGAYYAELGRGRQRSPPEGLLPTLDAALARLAAQTDSVHRRAAVGLVGVRRNLFPTAATPSATLAERAA